MQRRGLGELNSTGYPTDAPLTVRADWRDAAGRAPAGAGSMAAQVLDPFATRRAICNCLYGMPLLFSDDLAAAFGRAVHDWIAREWLHAAPRLRASIVVAPPPLGRRQHWPI